MEVLASRVLLRPRDLRRSLRFYGETIGLHVYREYDTPEGPGVVFFLGGGYLEISGSARSDAGVHRTALWLQVRDVAAAERHLRAVGVPVEQPATLMPWGLRELVARDPDGLKLVFVEVPAEHPMRRRPPGT